MRPSNLLLRVLTQEAYDRLAPKLKPVTLHAQQVLYHPNQPIEAVYFPENAVICQMTVMANGDTMETATVGFEGASWISAHIGAQSMPCETIVAIGGNALTLDVHDLSHELADNEHFADVLTTYSHALLIHCMRLAGCAGLHSLEQRCARWILTAVDRVGSDRFSVTHDFLAMMLGCRRPSVSTVVEKFEREGLVKMTRGVIILADREALARVACECYAIIKENYEQVGH
jgi:CRP-like cAMP-binding protein